MRTRCVVRVCVDEEGQDRRAWKRNEKDFRLCRDDKRLFSDMSDYFYLPYHRQPPCSCSPCRRAGVEEKPEGIKEITGHHHRHRYRPGSVLPAASPPVRLCVF